MREPRPDQGTRLAKGLSTESQSTTWRREAQRVISVLAHTGHPFHVDDLAMLVGNPPNLKQLGACLAAAKRQRLIEVAGAALVGGRLVRVWRGTT
jgi:hypothetical protein